AAARDPNPARSIPDPPASVEVITQDHADGADVPTAADAIASSAMPLGLSGAGDPARVQPGRDCCQAATLRVAFENLPNNRCLGWLPNPLDAETAGQAVPVFSVADRIPAVPEGNPAGAEALERLAFESPVGLPSQLS